MKIREASQHDIEKIINLVKQGLSDFNFTYSTETSEADLKNIHQEYLVNGGTFLLLENHLQELVAMGALKKLSPDTFKIRKMYVNKKYRSKGFGAQILLQLIEHAAQNQAKEILLETSRHMKAAINLYKKYGFQETNLKPESPRCDLSFIKKL